MRNLLTNIVFVLIASSLIYSCSSSRKTIGIEEGWDLLANRKVNFVRDKDEITVTNRLPYTAIRFQIEDKDVHISNLKIYFDNGDKLEPNIDEDIKAGEHSRIIELSSDGRMIDHFEFRYRTVGSILKGRANILIFGKRYASINSIHSN